MELLELANKNPYTLLRNPSPTNSPDPPDPPDTYRYTQRPDLDIFLQRVYQYYESRGLGCIVLTHVVNALIIGCTMIGLLFLGAFLDYPKLLQTQNLGESFVFSASRIHPILWITLIICFFFALRQAFQAVWEYRDKVPIRNFYRDQLHIATLTGLEWDEIATRLGDILSLNTLGQNQDHGVLEIAIRLMRRDNYIIAIFNRLSKEPNLLNLRIPGTSYFLYTKMVEWSLEYTLWSFILDAGGVRRYLQMGPEERSEYAATLKKRIRIFSLINLVLSPFLFIFVLAYSIFRYVEEIRNHPFLLGSREWTREALWKFREFNELPHIFQRRMYQSSPPAQSYVSHFPSALVGIVAKFLVFIGGAVAATLLLLGCLNQDLLLLGTLWGKTLIFYLGVFGGLVAVSRHFLMPEVILPDEAKYLEQVSVYTHYNPKSWRDPRSSVVRMELLRMFTYSVKLYLKELLSILVVPWIFLYSLPASIETLLDFIQRHTVEVQGMGLICEFADFTKFGEMAKVANRPTLHRTHQGKLEKSLINFSVHHPNWQPPPEGRHFLETLEQSTSVAGEPTASTWAKASKLPDLIKTHASMIQLRSRRDSPV
jgi:autophagy-related protein 9